MPRMPVVRATPKRITIHCSVTADGLPVSVETIRQWHVVRGFNDIGYHLIIQPSGRVDVGRKIDVVGAHVEGANTSNAGICLIGTERFTAAQFDSLRAQLDFVREVYQIPPWEIYCHYQFPSAQVQAKTCPNISINRLLAWYLLKDNAALIPNMLGELGAENAPR